MIPRATYRVQFHKDFTFTDAVPLVSYWAQLGISHVYASPIATARTGSTHGYDVIDPARIDPEAGGEEGFRTLVAALRAQGLGLILDIVPNHVAVGGSDNPWWLDVLEKGEASPFACFFDIDWRPADPALHGKLLVPFLGMPYAEALANGALALAVEAEIGRLSIVAHGTHRFPIRRDDYAALLAEAGAEDIDQLNPAALAALYDGRNEAGRARLHALLERQHYRLAWWQIAGDEINWRRFFDITELAGVRVEDETLFDAIHALPLRLYAEGLIDGVRVDHVDGLADPAGYCSRLRQRLEQAGTTRPADAPPGPAYLVVEKILASGEQLSPHWGADGTSGYDFMNEVSALLHAPEGAALLGAYWHEVSGRTAGFAEEEKAARIEILTRTFAGQLDAAAAAFHRVARSDLSTRDISHAALRRALVALLSVFPAYRTYGTGEGAPDLDAAIRNHAVREGRREAGPADALVVERIGRWLAGEGPGDPATRTDAVRRFQQLSAPVSAKAVEDTAFYRYGRLLSRNDVGFDPARLGEGPAAFCEAIATRAAQFPASMLTTATHDHKRGEDVRARLAVLSEIPERWIRQSRHWMGHHADPAVDRADAYQLYQMIVGAWPLDLAEDDEAGLAAFAERLAGWQLKALREAKLRSSWTMPDEAYEATCEAWLRRLLDPATSRGFHGEAAAFVRLIAPAGVAKSLVQTLLRYTLPGVPDLYQGTEFWDFSLVDPDNRRPVDFDVRRRALFTADARLSWSDGATKQALIARLLAMRRNCPDLFLDGSFERVPVAGPRAGDLLAMQRRQGSRRLLVVCAPRGAEACIATGRPAVPPGWWTGTELRLDDGEGHAVADLLGDGLVGFTLS